MKRFICAIFLCLILVSPSRAVVKECIFCHESPKGGVVKKPLTELCLGCHRERIGMGEHPVGMIPRISIPSGFPLTKDGRLTCISCHDPHSQEPMMLRVQPIALCNACHKK
ncbi:MAG: cytochrome c3 family protein [Nitrospirae bacterium]|nr:cytochrome c3 family protein [Nitrospirota bacterium]